MVRPVQPGGRKQRTYQHRAAQQVSLLVYIMRDSAETCMCVSKMLQTCSTVAAPAIHCTPSQQLLLSPLCSLQAATSICIVGCNH